MREWRSSPSSWWGCYWRRDFLPLFSFLHHSNTTSPCFTRRIPHQNWIDQDRITRRSSWESSESVERTSHDAAMAPIAHSGKRQESPLHPKSSEAPFPSSSSTLPSWLTLLIPDATRDALRSWRWRCCVSLLFPAFPLLLALNPLILVIIVIFMIVILFSSQVIRTLIPFFPDTRNLSGPRKYASKCPIPHPFYYILNHDSHQNDHHDDHEDDCVLLWGQRSCVMEGDSLLWWLFGNPSRLSSGTWSEWNGIQFQDSRSFDLSFALFTPWLERKWLTGNWQKSRMSRATERPWLMQSSSPIRSMNDSLQHNALKKRREMLSNFQLIFILIVIKFSLVRANRNTRSPTDGLQDQGDSITYEWTPGPAEAQEEGDNATQQVEVRPPPPDSNLEECFRPTNILFDSKNGIATDILKIAVNSKYFNRNELIATQKAIDPNSAKDKNSTDDTGDPDEDSIRDIPLNSRSHSDCQTGWLIA